MSDFYEELVQDKGDFIWLFGVLKAVSGAISESSHGQFLFWSRGATARTESWIRRLSLLWPRPVL